VFVVALGSGQSTALAQGDTSEIPHRRGAIAIDANLDDWTGPSLEISFEEPELAAPLANQTTVHLCWDREAIYVAFEVADGEVFLPPDDCPDSALYQYDSAELYLDTGAHFSTKMQPDDYQFIFSVGGRGIVLQGDPIIADDEMWAVPKTQRHGLDVHSAVEAGDGGYVVEAAIPLVAIGLSGMGAGHSLGLDVAVNDWLEDHAPFPTMDYTLANLALGEEGLPRYDDSQQVVSDRAYRPRNWSGSNDYGYPDEWRSAVLTGGPAFHEALAERVGSWRLALLLVLFTTALLGLGLWAKEVSHRRRIRNLTRLIEQREQQLLEAQNAAPPRANAEAETSESEEPRSEEPAGEEPPAEPPPSDEPAPVDPPSISSDPENSVQPAEEAAQELARKVKKKAAHAPADIEFQDLTARALAYLHEHLSENIRVGRLADALHVTTRTLQRSLRQSLGCSPRELILTVRMKEAKRLLETGTLRVSEVAYAVGFETPDHFSRRFKRYYGMSPSAVLEKQREARK